MGRRHDVVLRLLNLLCSFVVLYYTFGLFRACSGPITCFEFRLLMQILLVDGPRLVPLSTGKSEEQFTGWDPRSDNTNNLLPVRISYDGYDSYTRVVTCCNFFDGYTRVVSCCNFFFTTRGSSMRTCLSPNPFYTIRTELVKISDCPRICISPH